MITAFIVFYILCWIYLTCSIINVLTKIELWEGQSNNSHLTNA